MKRLIYLSIILLALIVFPAFGQNDTIKSPYAAEDTLQSNFGMFEKSELLELSLRFNLTEYTRKKPKDEYMDAILTYHLNAKDSINKNIRIKSRGEFRNQYCDFPPILVNLKKADLKKEDLKKLEKVKLVTHCERGNEENLLKEYLVYKLYNVLTDISFRVRLLRINYIDTNPKKKKKTTTAFGFFIEPVELLAERTNSAVVTSITLSQKNMIPEILDRMAIFNFMVGNADWSIPNQHNCKILSQANSPTPNLGTVVPYDFDYTGIVDASYAIPNETSKIKSVTDRIYTGLCRSKETFEKELVEFTENKEEFYKVINEFPYMNEKTKKQMLSYLDEFYNRFDKKNRIIDDLLSTCKE